MRRAVTLLHDVNIPKYIGALVRVIVARKEKGQGVDSKVARF